MTTGFLRRLPASIPGPAPLPLLGWRGNFLQLLRKPLDTLVALQATYGEVCAISHHNAGMVFAFGPEYNRQVLSDTEQFLHATQLVFYRTGSSQAPQRLSRGLLTINGAQHRHERRLMLPAFHRKHVEGYHATMVDYTVECLERWQVDQVIDLDHEMKELTARIALKTLMGVDSLRDPQVHQDIAYIMRKGFAPEVLFFPFNLPGTPVRKLVQIGERLDARYRQLIAAKRASATPQTDVLTALIEAEDEQGQRLTDDELVGETSTLFTAGHETSSNALIWTLVLLSQHPEIQAAVVDELRAVTGGAPPTLEQLGRLPLLERVIREAMRLLPSVVFVNRIAAADFTMGGYSLPKDTQIIISQFITQRLPELYPDPLRFRPERWETSDPGPYGYLPFGTGSRMCIGASFAMQEIKVILASLLARFQLEPVANLRVDPFLQITLAPKDAVQMRVRPQEQRQTRHPLRGSIHKYVTLPA